MALAYTVENLDAALAERLVPAITRWNRLEGRPRTHDFDRALKAEVRDALWMLAKQWQMGEFRGDDAGSPVAARVCIESAKIDRFQAAEGEVQTLDLARPLEAVVERRPLPLRADAQYLSLDLRMAVGRRWMKLLERDRAAGLLTADYRAAYLTRYAVPVPNPASPADVAVCAHPEAWRLASAAGARVMDGIALLEHLLDNTHAAADGIGADPADITPLATLADELRDWFEAMIMPPGVPERDAWLPSRLEYNFGCAAPEGEAETVLRADEYHHGRLEWYALERHPEQTRLGDAPRPAQPPEPVVHTFMPSSIVFEGMPNTRWWSFEDRRTNFGDVRPDTTDLGKLLLMEFALVYANDWFVLPYTLPIGTITDVKGIALTNVFGERTWIEPLREPASADFGTWSLFTLSAPPAGEATPPFARLVLLPTTPKVQESAAQEQVVLVRDEMANMVWGVERQIPLPSGSPKGGHEAARELRAFMLAPLTHKVESLERRKAELLAIPEADRTPAEVAELAAVEAELASILPPAPAAPIRYRVMNDVPENWIPFIPVHVDGSVREVQLQRAALPRILAGAPPATVPEKVRPRTSLLRQGLPGTYFLHEEEVPRAGAIVDLAYQRTRWLEGRVFCWYGARKQTGRGEGWSGLAFDQLESTK